jgi:hypothetical protein
VLVDRDGQSEGDQWRPRHLDVLLPLDAAVASGLVVQPLRAGMALPKRVNGATGATLGADRDVAVARRVLAAATVAGEDASARVDTVQAAAVALADLVSAGREAQVRRVSTRVGGCEALVAPGTGWRDACQWEAESVLQRRGDDTSPAGARRVVLAGSHAGAENSFAVRRGYAGDGAAVLVATSCGSVCLVAVGPVPMCILEVQRAFGGCPLPPVPRDTDLVFVGLRFLRSERGQQLTAQVGPAWSCMWRAHACMCGWDFGAVVVAAAALPLVCRLRLAGTGCQCQAYGADDGRTGTGREP